MSLLDSIVNFIKSLFKKEEEKPVTMQEVFRPKMTESVFDFMTSSEDKDTKQRLWNEMIEHEMHGEYIYSMRSNKWVYVVKNGQFTANPIDVK